MRASALAGTHRREIGGMRVEIGVLQADCLIANGMLPHHRLIDIGCAARSVIPYLGPAIASVSTRPRRCSMRDMTRKSACRLHRNRFPRANFRANADFDPSWAGTGFDVGLAQAVFTSMRLHKRQQCLSAPGAKMFTTFHEGEGAIVTHAVGRKALCAYCR